MTNKGPIHKSGNTLQGMKRSVKVRVPATTANLGPGFDVLGAALKLYNEIEVSAAPGNERVQVEVEGEGKETLPRDEKNVVWRSMQKTFSAIADKRLRAAMLSGSYHIRLVNRIPLAAGLGSSAAARTAGILAANELAGRPLSQETIASLGVGLEGHPDNFVPAFAGGLCISLVEDGAVRFVKLPAPKLKAVVCTPDFELATDKARKVVPKQLPLSSAVFNCSRLAFLIAALQTGQYRLLAGAMEDRLHQPARERLIPGMGKVLAAAKKAGAYGAALSGAGPSLIALAPAAQAKKTAAAMQNAWKREKISSRCFIIDFDDTGARITA